MARLCVVTSDGRPDPERLVRDMLRSVTDAPPSIVRTRAAALGVGGRDCDAFEDRGIAVALDGAIYNGPELRRELGLDRDCGDAEVVAMLWRRRGPQAALDGLNADFALAVADDEGLSLARDRFGLRPLYYAALPGDETLAASRPFALFEAGVAREPDPDYLATVAAANYRFFDAWPERSPYRDIRQLPAGHWLPAGSRHPVQWYQPPVDEPGDLTLDEMAGQYRDLLSDSVRLRLRDVPVPGFTLSGGLDSSSVVMTAYRLRGESISAFSTVYRDPTFDERNEIASIIETGAVRWSPVTIDDPELIPLIEGLVRTHDEPVATVTWLAHALLCQQAADQGVTHLFGGLGGDEQHAGEYDYFFYFFADLLARGETARHSREVSRWAELHDHPVHRKDEAVARAAVSRLTDAQTPGRCLANTALLMRYSDTLEPEWRARLAAVPEYGAPTQSYLHSHAFNEIYRNTIPCCLRASERNTTATGLADRLPFFDHRLVELALRVPPTEKIRDGVTKAFLRRAMRGVLPEATRTRTQKTGWNAPAHIWFGGATREILLDLVRSRAFAERGLYRPRVIEALAHEHFEIIERGDARENHMMLLWQVLNVELWLRALDQR